jgi:hypothetical protein
MRSARRQVRSGPWQQMADDWTHNLPVARPTVGGPLTGDLRVFQLAGRPIWAAKIIGDIGESPR